MKKLTKLIISILLFLYITLIHAEIEIITLQQGVDEYTGCIDTYLKNQDEIPPQGEAEELVLHGYH